MYGSSTIVSEAISSISEIQNLTDKLPTSDVFVICMYVPWKNSVRRTTGGPALKPCCWKRAMFMPQRRLFALLESLKLRDTLVLHALGAVQLSPDGNLRPYLIARDHPVRVARIVD